MTEVKTDVVYITIIIKCVSLYDPQHNCRNQEEYTQGCGSLHGALAMMT